jgi:hypothetical protein
MLALDDDEDAISRRLGSFLAQVVAHRGEEGVGDGDDPLVATLSRGDEQPPVGHSDIREAKAQDLAATQAAEDHGEHHRPVALGAQRGEQAVDLDRGEDLGARAEQRYPTFRTIEERPCSGPVASDRFRPPSGRMFRAGSWLSRRATTNCAPSGRTSIRPDSGRPRP